MFMLVPPPEYPFKLGIDIPEVMPFDELKLVPGIMFGPNGPLVPLLELLSPMLGNVNLVSIVSGSWHSVVASNGSKY